MSLVPENKPVEIRADNKTIWVYGVPYSGKTVFASTFPEPLMLNTDGNTKFIDTPRVLIRNQVVMSGRMKNITLAWDYLKQVIDELEEKNNSYKTIVVDLVEDLYQHCREFIYDRENIKHESDKTFSAWDMVTNEFLSVIGRLLTLDYDNIVLISHEDKSRDITMKNGDNVTEIKPNLRDKISIKLSGMVDLVGRIQLDDGKRSLQLQVKNVEFAGKRLPIEDDNIPLTYKALDELYVKALGSKNTETKGRL